MKTVNILLFEADSDEVEFFVNAVNGLATTNGIDARIQVSELSDTEDFRQAVSGGGPLAAQWKDKPHRLVFDLCRKIESAPKLQHRVLWVERMADLMVPFSGKVGDLETVLAELANLRVLEGRGLLKHVHLESRLCQPGEWPRPFDEPCRLCGAKTSGIYCAACEPPGDELKPGAKCQEASFLSAGKYLACGGPATAIVFCDKDKRRYAMCRTCATHNVERRGLKLVAGDLR